MFSPHSNTFLSPMNGYGASFFATPRNLGREGGREDGWSEVGGRGRNCRIVRFHVALTHQTQPLCLFSSLQYSTKADKIISVSIYAITFYFYAQVHTEIHDHLAVEAILETCSHASMCSKLWRITFGFDKTFSLYRKRCTLPKRNSLSKGAYWLL